MDLQIHTLDDLKILSNVNIITRVLLFSVQIDLYQTLQHGPMTLQELAVSVDCRADRLKRVLELLNTINLIHIENDTYSLSYVARRYLCGLYNRRLEGNLTYSYPENIFMEFIAGRHPPQSDKEETSADYWDKMEFNSRYTAFWLWRKLKPGKGEKLLDVGCGSGIFSTTLCENSRHLNVDCVDHQDVLEIAKKNIHAKGLENRITTHAYDIAKDDFTGGKAYNYILLSNILHFFSAAKTDRILKLCYRALIPGGILIVNDVFPISGNIETYCYSFMWMKDTGSLLLECEELLIKLQAHGYCSPKTHVLSNTPSTIIMTKKPMDFPGAAIGPTFKQ